MIALSLASLAFGAALASGTPVAIGTAATATPAAPAAVHAAAMPRRRHRNDALVAGSSNEPSDDEVIQEQFRMRVLMPALSGDGGG